MFLLALKSLEQKFVWFRKSTVPTAFSGPKSLMRIIILAGEVEHSAFKDKYSNICRVILRKHFQELTADKMESEINPGLLIGHIWSFYLWNLQNFFIL